jgi:hypothetical protein
VNGFEKLAETILRVSGGEGVHGMKIAKMAIGSSCEKEF